MLRTRRVLYTSDDVVIAVRLRSYLEQTATSERWGWSSPLGTGLIGVLSLGRLHGIPQIAYEEEAATIHFNKFVAGQARRPNDPTAASREEERDRQVGSNCERDFLHGEDSTKERER